MSFPFAVGARLLGTSSLGLFVQVIPPSNPLETLPVVIDTVSLFAIGFYANLIRQASVFKSKTILVPVPLRIVWYFFFGVPLDSPRIS